MDLERIKQELLEERDTLLQSSAATAESRKPVELDQQSQGRLSRMDAMQMQAMAKAADALKHARIQRIEAALQRIDYGEFGWCLTCGDDIAENRLMLDPTLAECLSCAQSR